MVRKAIMLALALSLGFQVRAAAPNDTVPIVSVEVSNFKFVPSDIHLKSGARVVLLLRNLSSATHDFSAPEFFQAAKVDPISGSHVENGTVAIPARSTLAIVILPAAGRFPLKCSHRLHSKLGMHGAIFVE